LKATLRILGLFAIVAVLLLTLQPSGVSADPTPPVPKKPVLVVPPPDPPSANPPGFIPSITRPLASGPTVLPPKGKVDAQRTQAQTQGGPGALSSTLNMTYHGGPVAHSVTVYTVFWDPSNTMSASYKNLINQYFGDISGTGFYGINSQYCDNVGATGCLQPGGGGGSFMGTTSNFGGTWNDTTAYPHAGTQARRPIRSWTRTFAPLSCAPITLP
jgi:hypothetical protein